jgi:hypothetical protein
MPVRLATKVLGLLLFGATAVLAQSPAYEAGQADRKAWEQWFDSLTGEYKSGAEFWAGQRNKPNPGSCYGSAGETLGPWTDGCVDAQRRLATTDQRRKNEPDYKLGWNHPNDNSSQGATGSRGYERMESVCNDADIQDKVVKWLLSKKIDVSRINEDETKMNINLRPYYIDCEISIRGNRTGVPQSDANQRIDAVVKYKIDFDSDRARVTNISIE